MICAQCLIRLESPDPVLLEEAAWEAETGPIPVSSLRTQRNPDYRPPTPCRPAGPEAAPGRWRRLRLAFPARAR
jgi:hypothetical protein